jgi:hypothetical protein
MQRSRRDDFSVNLQPSKARIRAEVKVRDPRRRRTARLGARLGVYSITRTRGCRPPVGLEIDERPGEITDFADYSHRDLAHHAVTQSDMTLYC